MGTASVVEDEVVGVNRAAVTALVTASVGLLILIVGSLMVRDPIWSMCIAMVGAGTLIGGFIHLPAAIIFLIAMNAATFLLLLLQGVGLCKTSCGGFVNYAYIGSASTAWVGCVVHFALAAAGWFVARRPDPMPVWYLAASAVGIGSSAFFLIVMATNQHWCPSCAAAHACMVAQAIMLWKMAGGERRFWGVCVLASVLLVNAVFHHRSTAEALGPGDRLLGWLASGADGVPVADPVFSTSVPLPTASAPVRDETVGPSTSPAVSPVTPEQRAQAAAALDAHTPLRTKGFYRWGDVSAPVTVLFHMSLVCPGCRAHWADIEKIRPLISRKEIQVEFVVTWPIQPETHYGAQLGAHVLLAAGMTGEDELLAAADLLFSTDGYELLNTVHRALLDDANLNHGKPSDALQREALVRLFEFVASVAPKAVSAFRQHKPLIDGNITSGFEWLLKFSKVDTPRYHFYRTGTDGSQHLSVTAVDAETWHLFAQRALANAVK